MRGGSSRFRPTGRLARRWCPKAAPGLLDPAATGVPKRDGIKQKPGDAEACADIARDRKVVARRDGACGQEGAEGVGHVEGGVVHRRRQLLGVARDIHEPRLHDRRDPAEDAHEKDLKIKEVPTVIRYDVPKGSSFTALSHGFTVLAWAMLSLSQKKPLLVLGLPGFGLFAAGAAMGLNAVNGISDSVDYLVGPGLTAVWIGVLGLAMMATGLVLQSARNFLRHLLIREFGLA